MSPPISEIMKYMNGDASSLDSERSLNSGVAYIPHLVACVTIGRINRPTKRARQVASNGRERACFRRMPKVLERDCVSHRNDD